jgi:hypothetical protein
LNSPVSSGVQNLENFSLDTGDFGSFVHFRGF